MNILFLHIACAAVSVSFFCVRAFWMVRRSPLLGLLWVRFAPHVVDTVLFMTGLTLAFRLGWPGWLVAKLVAVVTYILFGALALRRAPTRRLQVGSLVVALISVGYVLSVALTRTAQPWT